LHACTISPLTAITTAVASTAAAIVTLWGKMAKQVPRR
jgi:hypothetical protein